MTDRICLLVLCGCALAAGCGEQSAEVRIADGELRGSVVGGSRQFLGIPYARPPVGELRWRPPAKPEAWAAPRDATRFGKRCAQVASRTSAGSDDEDCLYLNVWTPALDLQDPLPEMVWIHGGGHLYQSASEPLPVINMGVHYSGQYLAAHHGGVVTLNYRLGVFGFFSHPKLAGEGGSGNQGLLDQRMALAISGWRLRGCATTLPASAAIRTT